MTNQARWPTQTRVNQVTHDRESNHVFHVLHGYMIIPFIFSFPGRKNIMPFHLDVRSPSLHVHLSCDILSYHDFSPFLPFLSEKGDHPFISLGYMYRLSSCFAGSLTSLLTLWWETMDPCFHGRTWLLSSFCEKFIVPDPLLHPSLSHMLPSIPSVLLHHQFHSSFHIITSNVTCYQIN